VGSNPTPAACPCRIAAIHAGSRRAGHLRIAGEEILEENEYYEVVKKAA
jgi:hypothetical protein